jgi:hypothetical protein
MGIWWFEAAIDRSYPVAMAGPVSRRRLDLVPFYRAILIGFRLGN